MMAASPAPRFLSNRNAAVGLLLVTTFLFFFKLGSIYLFDVDEAVFSEATREMVETGDWITPHYNEVNRYDKPILFYWMMALSYRLFGINEFGARFASAAMGVALVWMTYRFVSAHRGARAGWVSGFILATSLEMIGLAHSAITDMTLTFFVSLALFGFFQGYAATDPGPKRWGYWGCFVGMALAMLTKGLIGIVFPGAIILLFILLTGRLPIVLKEARPVSGTLLFMAVALPWYLLEFSVNGLEFFQAFFIKHHLTRYTEVVSGHRGPFYYFILVILIGFFPWSAFFPAALFHAVPKNLKAFRAQSPDRQLPLFTLLWFAIIFIFFSASKTKLPNYIATLFPAMAVLVGLWWEEQQVSDRWLKRSAFFLAAIGFLLGTGLMVAPTFVMKAQAQLPPSPFLDVLPELTAPLKIVAAVLFLGMLTAAYFLRSFQKERAFATMVATIVLFTATLLALVVPPVAEVVQGPLHDYATQAGEQLRGNEKLVVYGLNKPSVVFYARHSIVPFIRHEPESFEALKKILAAPERSFIITKSKLVSELQKEPSFVLLDQRGAYAFGSNRPLSPPPT
ncbi:MAG: glycosyltransferase family 39 protein [Nitrospirae bacterium]|nr:glycosyltransferase family 39 protein [Candidatus Manganitrophaceae bacterium]